jgi:hypothetical protein
MDDMTDERQRNADLLFYQEAVKCAVNYATEGIKSLFIVSGGASAALLAFLGHLVTIEERGFAWSLTGSLAFFFAAAIFGSSVFCFSYLSQLFYAQNAFAEGECASGKIFQGVAVVMTVIAYISCFAGLGAAYLAFMTRLSG